jgi:leader peptidase (prepilin peptidase) / N-methyltransferase
LSAETVTTTNLHRFWQLLAWGSPLGYIYSFVLGAVLGSFANVVIWRLPRSESLIKPGSHCTHCGVPIPLWRNVPIFSFFIQRGRTACCATALSVRYPIIELLCALILGSLYLNLGWSADFAFAGTWMILLVILGAIDVEHYRLPNSLVISGAIISLLWMILAPPHNWLQAGMGLLLGLVMAGAMLLAGKTLAGRWGGFGDFKLTLVLGFTFGPGQFLVLFLTATIAAMIYGLYRRRKSGEKRIPMGPFFALGVWINLWAGQALVDWYLGFFHLGY